MINGNDIWFLTFADSRFNSWKRLSQQAKDTGWFDKVIAGNERMFDEWYRIKYAARFNDRGFGYWQWKSYLIRRELDKMLQKPLSATQLKNAKRQLKGQIAIACDNREQFALDFGKSFLHYGWEKDITHLFDNIDKVTAADIQAVAQELFAPERLTTLILN